MNDQFEMRKEAVRKVLEEKGVALEGLDAVVGRGGLLHWCKAGCLHCRRQETVEN